MPAPLPVPPPDRLSPLRHPPRLRGGEEGDDEQRHATWLELFFDLVFVAAVASLADYLVERPDAIGFLRFVGFFVPIAWAWMGWTYYANRFDTDDVPYRLTVSAAMLAVGAMAVSIGDVTPSGTQRFALAYAGLGFLLLLLYGRAWWHVVRARPAINVYLIGFGLGFALWFASAFVPPPWRFVLWGVALLVEFGTPLAGWSFVSATPIDREHLTHRFGLFTIIVLGESLVAVVVGTDVRDWASGAVVVAVAGFVGALALWWIYFDFERGSDVRAGAWGFITAYGHPLLWIAITAYGAGVKLAIKHSDKLADVPGERWALAGGAALVLIVLGAFHLADHRREPPVIWLGRLACVGLLALIAAAGAYLQVTTLTTLVVFVLLLAMLLEVLSMRESLRGTLVDLLRAPERPGTPSP